MRSTITMWVFAALAGCWAGCDTDDGDTMPVADAIGTCEIACSMAFEAADLEAEGTIERQAAMNATGACCSYCERAYDLEQQTLCQWGELAE